MAGSASEDNGAGRSSEGISSADSLAEWRSCEQLENGTPSTSPPCWDTDGDNDSGASLLLCLNSLCCAYMFLPSLLLHHC